MSIDYNFRPGRERDAHGTPERVPSETTEHTVKRKCAADGCERGAIVASKFCYDHLQQHWGEVKATGKKATVSRAKASKPRPTSKALPSDVLTVNSSHLASLDDSERIELARYAPPQTELERARWRYQLSPQLSDDEVLQLWRDNPANEKGVSDV
jgi:hypothetical protein